MNQPEDDPFREPATPVRLREEGLAWRQVADDLVMLDTEAGRYHAVNPSGAVLWDRLSAGCTVGELVSGLVERYPDAADRAADDVARFLSDLDTRGFLVVGDGPPAT